MPHVQEESLREKGASSRGDKHNKVLPFTLTGTLFSLMFLVAKPQTVYNTLSLYYPQHLLH